MDRNYDLCSGRDSRGRQWYTRLPAGVARTGLFVRLLGGTFILIDRVEQDGLAPAAASMCAAVQVLESVWEGRCRVCRTLAPGGAACRPGRPLAAAPPDVR